MAQVVSICSVELILLMLLRLSILLGERKKHILLLLFMNLKVLQLLQDGSFRQVIIPQVRIPQIMFRHLALHILLMVHPMIIS